MQQAGGGTPPQQQLQHILSTQQGATQQHQTRMQIQGGMMNQPGQGLNQGPGQPMTQQQQQWYKHQQMLQMQRQQQQQVNLTSTHFINPFAESSVY